MKIKKIAEPKTDSRRLPQYTKIDVRDFEKPLA